jgi:hypothetical protein
MNTFRLTVGQSARERSPSIVTICVPNLCCCRSLGYKSNDVLIYEFQNGTASSNPLFSSATRSGLVTTEAKHAGIALCII